MLPDTRHKWTHPDLTRTRQTGTRFIYPGEIEGWVDLDDRLNTEMVYVPANGHPSKYSGTNPAVHGRESNSQPVSWSQVRRPNHDSTKPAFVTDIVPTPTNILWQMSENW